MDIIQKMKTWDTWDAMVKDLYTYRGEVARKIKTHNDPSIIQDFYILKLIIIPKVIVEFDKELDELRGPEIARLKEYYDVVADIVKLHRNRVKLHDVLQAHPDIMDFEKDGIRGDMKKQHAIETKAGDENSVVEEEEDSKMQAYLKAKCDELVKCKAKVEQIILQKQDKSEFRWMLSRLLSYLGCQKLIRLVPSNLHVEHKKQVQSMMADSEDNSCSSTQAKKWCASSEDYLQAEKAEAK